jgi:hypothetical protein
VSVFSPVNFTLHNDIDTVVPVTTRGMLP